MIDEERTIAIVGSVLYGAILLVGFIVLSCMTRDPIRHFQSRRVATFMSFCFCFLPTVFTLGAIVPWICAAYGSKAPAIVFVTVPGALLVIFLISYVVLLDASGFIRYRFELGPGLDMDDPEVSAYIREQQEHAAAAAAQTSLPYYDPHHLYLLNHPDATVAAAARGTSGHTPHGHRMKLRDLHSPPGYHVGTGLHMPSTMTAATAPPVMGGGLTGVTHYIPISLHPTAATTREEEPETAADPPKRVNFVDVHDPLQDDDRSGRRIPTGQGPRPPPYTQREDPTSSSTASIPVDRASDDRSAPHHRSSTKAEKKVKHGHSPRSRRETQRPSLGLSQVGADGALAVPQRPAAASVGSARETPVEPAAWAGGSPPVSPPQRGAPAGGGHHPLAEAATSPQASSLYVQGAPQAPRGDPATPPPPPPPQKVYINGHTAPGAAQAIFAREGLPHSGVAPPPPSPPGAAAAMVGHSPSGRSTPPPLFASPRHPLPVTAGTVPPAMYSTQPEEHRQPQRSHLATAQATHRRDTQNRSHHDHNKSIVDGDGGNYFIDVPFEVELRDQRNETYGGRT